MLVKHMKVFCFETQSLKLETATQNENMLLFLCLKSNVWNCPSIALITMECYQTNRQSIICVYPFMPNMLIRRLKLHHIDTVQDKCHNSIIAKFLYL